MRAMGARYLLCVITSCELKGSLGSELAKNGVYFDYC